MPSEYDKYLCQVCKTNPIYDSQGIPLSMESEKCECCGKRTCGTCGYWAEDRQTMNENKNFPEYLYSTFLADDFICHNCVTNAEKDYIDEIPKEDLPLHINDEWYQEENKDYFSQKLLKNQGDTPCVYHPKNSKKNSLINNTCPPGSWLKVT